MYMWSFKTFINPHYQKDTFSVFPVSESLLHRFIKRQEKEYYQNYRNSRQIPGSVWYDFESNVAKSMKTYYNVLL